MTTKLVITVAALMLVSGSEAQKIKLLEPQCKPGFSDVYPKFVYPYYYKCSSEGKVVIDHEISDSITKNYQDDIEKKRKLYWALRTRVLTDQEMAEVERLDLMLIIPYDMPFKESEKRAEFNAALLQQFRIRDIARRGCKEVQ